VSSRIHPGKPAVLDVRDELPDRLANAEDLALAEAEGQTLRDQPPFGQQLFQGPEGHLAVVRRRPDAAAVRVPIGQIARDLPVPPGAFARPHAFRLIPEGIADGQPEQHALQPVEVER
jgi:hypothetical protein